MKGHNGTSHRTERIASVIKRAVSVIIDTELEDPRIQGVSVADVEVTKDLRHATVFVCIENDDKDVLAALEKSAGFIRRTLCEELSEMRAMPQLHFVLDKSGSYYEHIEEIIKSLHHDESGK